MTSNNPPKASSQLREDGSFLSYADVEERLVEAMQLWARTPGDGGSPYASDGPWQLLTRLVRMSEAIPVTLRPSEKSEIMGQLLRADDEAETRQWQGRERRMHLTRDEVDRRDEASEWLTLLDERDRGLVIIALHDKANARRVRWDAIWKANGRGKPGPEGLQMRYRKAVSTICQHLNAPKSASKACQAAR